MSRRVQLDVVVIVELHFSSHCDGMDASMASRRGLLRFRDIALMLPWHRCGNCFYSMTRDIPWLMSFLIFEMSSWRPVPHLVIRACTESWMTWPLVCAGAARYLRPFRPLGHGMHEVTRARHERQEAGCRQLRCKWTCA